MSRINTNVSSLVAQNRLTRSNNDLQQALTRLSTGLRINAGKDDPAGLIASENLRRDITAIDKAISNSERAAQVIATADSALGQVSKLLNDIRGLVSEAANTGALSAEQTAANQLQVDSSLEAIDRISQTTTFQGRRLLDGSLNFLVSEVSGFNNVSSLRIDQANLGATGSINVDVNISAAATRAQITNAIPDSAAGQLTLDGQTFTLRTDPSQNLSSVAVDVEVNDDASAIGSFTIDGFEFRTRATGTADNNITVAVSTNDTANFDHGARATLTFDQSTVSVRANETTNFDDTTVAVATSALGAFADSDNIILTDGTNDLTFTIAARAGGAAAGESTVNVAVVAGAVAGAPKASANYVSGTNTLTITLDSGEASISKTDIETAIESATLDSAAAPAQIFDATPPAGATTLDGTAAVALDGASDTTLVLDQVTAAFDAISNTLTLTLNSDIANVTTTSIKAAIDALTEFNDGNTSVTGPTNIALANVTASATYGTLVRPTVLTSYSGSTLTIDFDDQNAAINVNDVITAINNQAQFSETALTTATAGTINGTVLADNNNLATLTRLTTGVAARFNSTTSRLTLTFDGSNSSITNANILAAVNGLTAFDGSTATNATGTVDGGNLTSASNVATAAQVQDLVIRLSGARGSEVFSFDAGTSFAQVASAIALVSDAIGVTAEVVSNQLRLTSTDYGSNAFVDVEVISEGTGGTFESNLSVKRDTGTDIQASVNGVQANADGNRLSINTATLDLTLTVTEGTATDVSFTIDAGGAVFQLGPSVVSNQQARIGISGVGTGELGGASGRLYQLRSGGDKTLERDANGAARIVDEAINAVTSLRGRLGAFQRTTIESNIASLSDTLVNLTEAESSIRDADFAKESAALTRAQILVQSGTTVLALANQNPQNVLALLR